MGNIKILHLISSGGMFGAENVILNLAQNLNNGNVGSLICAINENSEKIPAIIQDARDKALPTYILNCKGKFDLTAILRLRDFLNDNKIQILHSHNYKANMIGFFAAKMAGIPILTTVHGYTHVNAKVRCYEAVDQALLKLFFDRIVVVSDALLDVFKNKKTQVIANGIDINKFDLLDGSKKLRSQLNITGDSIVVGTVGRLSKEKNQEMIIRSAAALCQKHENIKFLIVGDGPERKSLEGVVRQLNLEKKVIFIGILKDIKEAYSAMDIFVLSSFTEGTPIVILEAMSMQRLVIATKVGGVSSIIKEKETGFLIDSKSTVQLEEQIEFVLKNKDITDRIRKEARNFVCEHFSLEKMINKYTRIYEEMLKGQINEIKI